MKNILLLIFKLIYLLENIFNSWNSKKYFINNNPLTLSFNYFNFHHYLLILYYLFFHHNLTINTNLMNYNK
jgi:hypothetical protein